MKNKKITITLFIIFTLVLTTGWSLFKKKCKDVKITFLNSMGEIQVSMEEIAKIFSSENPGIKVEIIPCPAGISPFKNYLHCMQQVMPQQFL